MQGKVSFAQAHDATAWKSHLRALCIGPKGPKEGRLACVGTGRRYQRDQREPRKEFIKLICRGDASRKFRRWPHFIIVENYSLALVHVRISRARNLLLSLGEARAFYRHFLRAVRYSGISRRFGDRKNEKRKKGGEDDRPVRQKRNIVLICMIDARGEFVLRPR